MEMFASMPPPILLDEEKATMNKSLATSLALSAAALFVGACGKSGESADSNTAASSSGDQVKCLGVNECKGQGSCGGPDGNVCAGQNSCKGKGWIKMTQGECADLGGEVLP